MKDTLNGGKYKKSERLATAASAIGHKTKNCLTGFSRLNRWKSSVRPQSIPVGLVAYLYRVSLFHTWIQTIKPYNFFQDLFLRGYHNKRLKTMSIKK